MQDSKHPFWRHCLSLASETQPRQAVYHNPLRDIGRSISNSQQAKTVVMSYMLGVSLIAKSLNGAATEKEQQALSGLTQQALEQLERFTEERLKKKNTNALHKAAEQATNAGLDVPPCR